MNSKMGVALAECGECLATCCTFKWFLQVLSGMDTHMPVTCAACVETLTTHCTTERFCSTVYQKVCDKFAGLGETFTTFCTFIRFLSGMDPNMLVQFTVSGETLCTYFTVKGFSSAMGIGVFIKHGLHGETLPAYSTFEWHVSNTVADRNVGIWFFFWDKCGRVYIHGECSCSLDGIISVPRVTDTSRIPQMIHGPLTRYAKLQFAHAPGMPGTFSPAADFKGNR